MKSPTRLWLLAPLCAPLCAAAWTPCPGLDTPSPAGDDQPRYELFVSPYTYHWSDKDAALHRKVFAGSVTRLLPDDRFCGFSVFRNSFGQPSAYAYTGWSWPSLWPAHPRVYGTVTAGIIYGYVGEFKDKVPLNLGGFSPVIIPAVGYRLTPRMALEVQILGTAAVMVGTTWRF